MQFFLQRRIRPYFLAGCFARHRFTPIEERFGRPKELQKGVDQIITLTIKTLKPMTIRLERALVPRVDGRTSPLSKQFEGTPVMAPQFDLTLTLDVKA